MIAYFFSVLACAALTVAVLSIACLACLFLGAWLHDRAAARFDEAEHARVAAEFGSEPYSPNCRCRHCDDARELVALDRWFSKVRSEVEG